MHSSMATAAYTKPPILNLPFEIYCLIVELLSSDDIYSLSLVCSLLRGVLRDNSICRAHLQRSIPFANELSWPRSLGGFDRSLYARTKRLNAIANLEPFAAAVVAYAEAYLYMDNTLIYVRERVMRILDLNPNTTVRSERIVDVRALLDAALPESHGTTRYSFQPLHYAAGIVSCVYAHHRVGSTQENWLVFSRPDTGWSMSCPVPFPHHRLFVRNTKEFLVYGMFTARTRITTAELTPDVQGAAQDTQPPQTSHHFETVADDGGAGNHRHWRLRHLDLVTNKWCDFESYQLDDVIGLGEFGKDICFEIIDGYFYIVASQQRFLDHEHQMEYMSTPHWDDFYAAGQDGTDADRAGGDYYIDDFSGLVEGGKSLRNNSSSSDNSEDEPINLVLSQKSTSESEDENDNDNDNDTANEGTEAAEAEHTTTLSEAADELDNGSACTRAALFRNSSYYSCFRFRITNDKPIMEQPTLKSRWRRRNNEGSLDDRWSTLKLSKSVENGDIIIIEQRKEWLAGSSNSRRTYYMQPLVWPSDMRERDWASKASIPSPSCTSTRPGYTSPSSPSSPSDPAMKRKRLPLLSDLLPQRRLAKDVHFGDDASLMDPPTLSQCHGRFYSRDASTFLDLVDINIQGTVGAQQIALRAGSRTLSQAPKETKAVHPSTWQATDHPLYPIEEMEMAYVAKEVVTWPKQKQQKPDADPNADPNANAEVAKDTEETAEDLLRSVLTPPGYSGSVISAWDDRLLVYSTKMAPPASTSTTTSRPKPVRAVVMISFDPTLCLPGLKIWRDRDLETGEPRLVQGKTKRKSEETREDMPPAWASTGEPSYLAINSGYDFSYHVNSQK